MRFRQVLALAFFFAGGAIGLSSPSLAAQFGVSAGPPVAEQNGLYTWKAGEAGRSGAFHGFDPAQRVVWIDDYLYHLDARAKVVGNSTKLGLLSAIRRGETVEFSTVPDPKDARRKLIVEIRRK